MILREEMEQLVRAQTELDDPMETAIQIRREDREAWLVELIPTLRTDDHPERPIAFNPGLSFRHPLNLIVSNLDGLRRAIRSNRQLAQDVAAGEILFGSERGRELQEIARTANGNVEAG